MGRHSTVGLHYRPDITHASGSADPGTELIHIQVLVKRKPFGPAGSVPRTCSAGAIPSPSSTSQPAGRGPPRAPHTGYFVPRL